tara:strand:- start:7213 stop:7395 length:183 start_codon:yes stop_codon:yes gene_type:complete
MTSREKIQITRETLRSACQHKDGRYQVRVQHDGKRYNFGSTLTIEECNKRHDLELEKLNA